MSRTARRALVAFEGVEGAGKSTQIRLLASALQARGYDVITTREPGGTALGAELRQLVMHRDDPPPAPLAELLLYLADRAEHISQVIEPALNAGKVVLTDRFSASTIAYQGYARGLDLELVERLDAVARQGVAADLTLLCDCSVEEGLRRAHGDDRFHREDIAFHQRVRHGFHELARRPGSRFVIVDATQPAALVHAQCLDHVLQCLSEHP